MNYCQFRNLTIKRMCNSVKPLLPPEYQQVEYIESTGAQYLNIGAAKNHQYYYFDFMQINGVYSYYASQYNLNGLFGYNNMGADCKTWLSYTTPYKAAGTLNGTAIGSATIELNTRYEYYLSPTRMTLNGVDYTSGTTGNVTSNTNCYIFTCNSSSPSAWMSAVRLYRLETSSINLYPCFRKSDNKPGMYDLVSGTFYVNQGTGEFTVGNLV